MATQIYFIDKKLENYQTIIDSLSSTDIYYLIDSSTDGLTQMSNILLNYSNLDSIHVYSHGDVGSLNIGNSIYDNANISNYKIELENIGKSLSSTGDILLYGCNVGQDEVGQKFINQIAEFSQSDVAASDDLTGNKVLGGDWDLEVVSGVVEAQSLKVEDYESVMLDDHSDTITNATVLTVGTAKNGNIEVIGDKDYFKVDLVAGQRYLFEMNDLTMGSGTAYLNLYNNSNSFLNYDSEGYSDNKAQFSYLTTYTGTYYLKASDVLDNSTGTYDVKVSKIVSTDDHSDTITNATVLTVGTAKNGNIEVIGDKDYFKVDLVAGQRYLFEMNDLTMGSGTAYLNLYNNSNSFLNYDSEGYSDNKAQFSYLTTYTGTYYLKASDVLDNSTGTYDVKVSKIVSTDDHSDTITNATVLTVGTAKNGNIEVIGDKDYFKVDLVAGQRYLFEMNDLTMGSGTAYLNLYNNSNSFLNYDSEGYSDNKAQFSYLTTYTGTYYLKASDVLDNSTGTYDVKVSKIVSTDDHSDTITNATVLTVGTAKNGNIEVIGDKDYFKVDLVAGQRYLFEMNDLTMGSGTAYLNLYNKSRLQIPPS